jgi:hypothetical protein
MISLIAFVIKKTSSDQGVPPAIGKSWPIPSASISDLYILDVPNMRWARPLYEGQVGAAQLGM